jgi:hypothetical protein
MKKIPRDDYFELAVFLMDYHLVETYKDKV